MAGSFGRVFTVSCIALIFISAVISLTEATYRKPPFNGSIFGKRAGSNEYDNANKALSAMCEIANEACQSWFPMTQEK